MTQKEIDLFHLKRMAKGKRIFGVILRDIKKRNNLRGKDSVACLEDWEIKNKL